MQSMQEESWTPGAGKLWPTAKIGAATCLCKYILALAVLSALTFVAMFAVAFIAAGVELALIGG